MTSKTIKNQQTIDLVKKQINSSQKQRCEEITIESCKIGAIEKGMFAGFAVLKSLYISNNEIEKIGNAAFEGIVNLKYLYLNNNNIKNIEGTAFKGLTKLSDLDLSNNKITKLVTGVFLGLSMTSSGACLNLSNNGIEEIEPDALKNVTVLYGSLEFNNNKLKSLGVESSSCLLIEKYNLADNQITSIDERAFQASNFKFLHLENNKIDKIHTDAFKGMEVQNELHLENNKITNYARVFQYLGNLKELYLDGNGITNLPDNGFEGLETLFTLSLRNNNISTLTRKGLGGVPKLEYLYMNGNKMSKLESGLFKDFAEFRHLHLANNAFTSLPANSFVAAGESAAYISINLDGNKITKIEGGAFNGIDRIDDLRLRGNGLSAVDANTFKGLTYIGVLDLQDNAIASVDVLNHLPPCRHIKLGGNKFEAAPGVPVANMVADTVELISFKNACYKKTDEGGFLFDDTYVEQEAESE